MYYLLKNAVYGAVLGVTNIIPGLSVGTVAVVLNIYDRLISAISDLRKDFANSMKFLVPLVLAAGVAMLAVSRGMTYLLAHYAMATNFFFIGLILGSIPTIYQRSKAKAVDNGGTRWSDWIAFALSLALMLVIALFSSEAEPTTALTSSLDIVLILKLFAAGLISALCMVIPGISGSFVLLLIGFYEPLVMAISTLQISMLLPAGIGVIVGMFLGSKLIKSLLARFPSLTYFSILGFVVGSIPVLIQKLYLRDGFRGGWHLAVSIVVLLLGVVIVTRFGKSHSDAADSSDAAASKTES